MNLVGKLDCYETEIYVKKGPNPVSAKILEYTAVS